MKQFFFNTSACALWILLAGGCSGSPAPSGSDATMSASGGAGGSTDPSGSSGGDTNQPTDPGAGGTTAGSGGSSSTDGWPLLDPTGNPIYQELTTYQSWLSTASGDEAKLVEDQQVADNMLTWQLPHGGFDKHARSVYDSPWNGSDARSGWHGEGGVELGTIDNDATVTQLLFLADVYRRSGEARYRDGARAALDFLLTMQAPSGGFPQVYPARTGTTYSNHVTFNDDAMARVLILLHQIGQLAPPLDGDLFTEQQRADAEDAVAAGVDFILKAQIDQDGVKTVWCAQHDPVTYEPRGARSYELPSKSGKESVNVVAFLMTQPQAPEVQAAVQAAIAWYRSEAVQLEDTAYVKRPSDNTDDNYNPIQASPGQTMWCRFYDLSEDVCFFSGRLPTDDPPGSGKQYDIMNIEPERRYGYEWGGNYGNKLFAYTDGVGY